MNTSVLLYPELKDLPLVRKAMVNVSQNWFSIGINFRVPHSKLDDIRRKYRNESERSLNAVLAEWLNNYNPKYGPPTWRSIVATIASRVGGDNPAEAKRIAENYTSEFVVFAGGSVELQLSYELWLHFLCGVQVAWMRAFRKPRIPTTDR